MIGVPRNTPIFIDMKTAVQPLQTIWTVKMKSILITFFTTLCFSLALGQQDLITMAFWKEHKEVLHRLDIMQTQEKDSVLFTLIRALNQLPAQSEPLQRAGLNHAIGALYLDKKEFGPALRHLNAARSLYNLVMPDSTGVRLISDLAKAFFHRGNYFVAGQNFMDALRTNPKPEPALENEIRDYLARIYNMNASINLDPPFFIQSMELKKKLGDYLGMLRVAQRLTTTFYDEKQYARSRAYAGQAIDLADQLGLPEDRIFSTIEKANSTIRLSRFQEGMALLENIQAQIPPADLNLVSRFETTLGNYYLVHGMDSIAEIHYKKALPVRNSPLLNQHVNRNKAESYEQAGRFKEALDYYHLYTRELTVGSALNVQSAITRLEENSARLKFKDEIRYLNTENQLMDSLLNKEKLLAEALSSKNQIQSEQLENQTRLSASLQREMVLQEQKFADEKKMRFLFFGASLIFLLLGGLLYFMYIQQRNKNRIIEKQAEEMEVLMKEIHHRVKNNLQIISSLLDLQSLSIRDQSAYTAIREGKNRVQSMALIHQNLYRDGNIRSINVKDYIQHLVSSLFDSYQIEKNKINLNTDIHPLLLDVDTVVPIGLIVNELISNSLKYAFNQQDSGHLSITLKPNGNGSLYFRVKDSGVGFPPGWKPDAGNSFGYQLIRAFAKKLKAKVETYNEQGAVVALHITKYKII